MTIRLVEGQHARIAVIESEGIVIDSVQSALDLFATIWYESQCNRVVIDKKYIVEEFFDLKTRLAGEVLQKFIQYGINIAIVGDFSIYSSKSLRDFIYESNQGQNVFFVSTEAEGIEKLDV